ncbi:MAG: alpha-ketoglutaric semialdehyde dehydrogenase [Phenylobacterium sp.]|jgi:alpha-ketoglutaric semialdehyde dehydrogenase
MSQNNTQHKILIAGQWIAANAVSEFQPANPTSGENLAETYPKSSWADCDAALTAAAEAFVQMQTLPRATIGQFLDGYATSIEDNISTLAEMAHLETGLPISPRLADGELPRTINQLRQAAAAARESSWTTPTIDTNANIRSMLQAIGPVAVFGPNNFPFAFGSISGGDFAAAIAAGNPVIAKAHPSHPGTTRLLAELAHSAANKAGLPKGAIQLIYCTDHASGQRMVSDPRIAATGFTGSRGAGLALKKAADEAGKAIYLELSSINPVVVLAGALRERCADIATEYVGSCLMAAGQLCTKPGLMIVPTGNAGDHFVKTVTEQFNTGPVGTLFSAKSADYVTQGAQTLQTAGASVLTQAKSTQQSNIEGGRFCIANTLLSVSGEQFIADSEALQTEMFGNASLIIRTESATQTVQIVSALEGNLTGCLYSHSDGSDDADYDVIEPVLRQKVGRVINDKMPTGVAVSAAMNHGGPFPSSGHPGFTAVGLPGAVKRFGALKCFDNVRQHRLPEVLQDTNPDGKVWRLIDGQWTTSDAKQA